jgi:hypothetical protein
MHMTATMDGATAVKHALDWFAAMPADIDAAIKFDQESAGESQQPLQYSPLNEREKQMLVAVYRAFLGGGKKAMDAQVESLLKFGVLEFSTFSSPAESQAALAAQ